MTDLPPPADDSGTINEILSAYLDGEATPDEVALIEADPALLARVEVLRSTSLAMTPAPAPVALRERHLGAALDLFDQQHGSGAPAAATTATPQAPTHSDAGSISSLEVARERKRPRRLTMVTGIAAALALVFAGIVAFGVTNTRSDEVVSADVATSDSAVAMESSVQDASAPMAEASDADAGDDAADEEAMDDEAMDETEEAMDDEAMDETEEAMADDAMDEAEEGDFDDAANDASSAAAHGATSEAAGANPDSRLGSVLLRQPDAEARFADSDFDPLTAFTAHPLFVGQFDNPVRAAEGFTDSVHASVISSEFEQAQRGAFAPLDCSEQLRDVTDLDGSTLIATATIQGDAIEFHRTSTKLVLVVDHQSCNIDSRFATS